MSCRGRCFCQKGFRGISEKKSEPRFTNGKTSGKKKAYTALLQCRTFLCRKKWGPQRKDFGGGSGFPGFHRDFVSTTDLESFSLRPEKFPKGRTRKNDSKVTFGVPVKVTRKLLESDSKVTFSTVFVTFESLLSNFWVAFTGTPKVTFESLFRVLEFFGVGGL